MAKTDIEKHWVAVKEFNLTYHFMDIEKTLRYLNYGNLI